MQQLAHINGTGLSSQPGATVSPATVATLLFEESNHVWLPNTMDVYPRALGIHTVSTEVEVLDPPRYFFPLRHRTGDVAWSGPVTGPNQRFGTWFPLG